MQYFGDGVEPIKAPQNDAAWEQLIRELCAPSGESPTEKIINHHKEATS